MIEEVSTREGYDRWSVIYDDEDNPLVALETPVVHALLAEVSGLRIADIGCGTGRHALRLAERGALVTALDFSEGMLNRARARAAVAERAIAAAGGRITLIQHDLAEPLPLPDAAFDRVLCCLVLDHIAEPGRLLSELGRICAPQGEVIATVMHPALLLKGLQARFVDPQTGREVRPASYPNQMSDYVMGVTRAGLTILDMREAFADAELAGRCPRAEKYVGWPMLLTLRLGRSS